MPDIEQLTNALPEPDHERSYEEIRTIGMSIRKKGDAYDWHLGDLAEELSQRAATAKERFLANGGKEDALSPNDVELKDGTKKAMHRLSDDLGIQTMQLAKRRYVSRIFPREHRARTLTLSYSLVREIATVPDQEKRESLLTQAAAGKMTVNDVVALVGKDRDKNAAAQGLLTCTKCRETIKNVDAMIRLQADNTTFLFDTWQCAALFAQERAVADTEANLEDEMLGALTEEDYEAVEA